MADETSYPEAWKPRHIKAREHAEAQRADDAVDYISALTDDDLTALIARTRPAQT